ncbi:dihydroorotase [Bacillus subtilis]|uniref:dihydroorotase n=1 Tax=Bacillus subtilis TaxID=1423 RepID=UPI0001976E94|nr:dihydroorotase [Bacillus subtilis]
MSYLIKNGWILNENGEKTQADIRVTGETITAIGKLDATDNETVIDAKGLLVSPGFVDLHVHFREPGGEKKETIETGAKAAARGGYTTVAAMPNTRPVPDTKEQMEWVQNRIKETSCVRVLPYASITIRQIGDEMTNFEALKEAGAFAFTDDGVGIQTAGMMYEAMKRAAAIDKAIVAHCEDNSLIYGGSVHEGTFSKANGLNGIPSVCESVHIARDVLLAETNCHYHVCHISTKESVRVVRDAKKAGIRVTAEVSPHHLLLCDEDIPGLDTNYKMNPPLRSPEDRAALIEGLLDGTIDFIATDHAPHTEEEKNTEMKLAPFRNCRLRNSIPASLHTLCQKWQLVTEAADWNYMTIKPCEAFGLPYGTLQTGQAADITLIDLEKEAVIDKETFLSKGKNTPFNGISCTGWPVATIAAGKLAYEEGRLVK